MDTQAAPLESRPHSAQRRIDRLLAHYGQSHQHPTNERIHVVAIPAIMLSIVGMLHALHPWAAYAFVAGSLVYYALLRSPMFLVVMLLWTAALLAIVHALGERVLVVSVTLFVVGWIFQFIGHKIEGKKPSFFEDLQYLYVGPLFVADLGLRRLGIRA
ncbi:DUF962 domain-containing protein [Xenophilus arseniciresistens]|uniref:DUF962 domain-containing protein n=1 Tax=Xenophilus arseniciresistens TaxID=1283306 RepID=A0AAE3N7Z3_9BURK|nr:Mpo1-like protein [Xenophilus arseniciresistens]MDA7415572.1 DUF962 domain-containing protein [Xenophilus arseniciresistens]